YRRIAFAIAASSLRIHDAPAVSGGQHNQLMSKKWGSAPNGLVGRGIHLGVPSLRACCVTLCVSGAGDSPASTQINGFLESRRPSTANGACVKTPSGCRLREFRRSHFAQEPRSRLSEGSGDP